LNNYKNQIEELSFEDLDILLGNRDKDRIFFISSNPMSISAAIWRDFNSIPLPLWSNEGDKV
jgi:hypothetical protein